jgi:hypothetical protein
MNLKPVYALVLLSCVAELGACKALLKKKDPDPAPAASVVVAPPPAVVAPLPTPIASAAPVPEAAPVAAAVDESTIPASQDFEDEAFAKVTTANFRAQLATLKVAISKP